MRHIKILLLSLASSMGAMATDMNVTPGQLSNLLAAGMKGQTELKLKGGIDARDLAALENLPEEIKRLDLSEVKIEALTMPSRQYFGRTLFKEGEIPAYTFFKSGLTMLILPQDISIICDGAFAGSLIKEIVIPDGITALGDYAFYGCPELKSVTLPSSLKSIGKGVFGNCMELETIDLSKTDITEIPNRAFAGSMTLREVKLPSSVIRIGREAFSHTAIKALELGNVTEFDDYALSSMPWLEALIINPDAVIREGLLMDDTSLSSLTGTPEMVPDYFAANCGNLETTVIRNSDFLGKYSFANTLAPEELILPGFLSTIERGAFSGLNTLKKIDVSALEDRVPHADEFTFEGLNQEEIILWVSDDAFNVWESAPFWNIFQVASANHTGIDESIVHTDSNINISRQKGLLVIESTAILSDVRIYTADGRLTFVASPDRDKVEIDAASLPSGIVIVAASDKEGNSRTLSIML